MLPGAFTLLAFLSPSTLTFILKVPSPISQGGGGGGGGKQNIEKVGGGGGGGGGDTIEQCVAVCQSGGAGFEISKGGQNIFKEGECSPPLKETLHHSRDKTYRR